MSKHEENINARAIEPHKEKAVKFAAITNKVRCNQVCAENHSEIKQKFNELKNQFLSNKDAKEKQNFTFGEVLALWLNNGNMQIKKQTYAKYQYMIERHIAPLIGNILIDEIENSVINNFLSYESSKGKLSGNGGLSTSYIQTMRFIINSALNYSQEQGYCRALSGEINRPNKKAKKEIEILTIYEQTTLEKYLINDIDNHKLGILVSLYTGLRIGEVCGLMWSDIDFSSKTIHVRHTVERVKNVHALPGEKKTELVLCGTKALSSNRIIPIPSKIFPLMKRCSHEGDFFMSGKTYEFTDPRTYQYCFHRYLDECQIRSINYHALRHTFATRCIEVGMDIKSLSEILGHANVNITLNIYVHSSMEQKRKQLEQLCSVCGK